MIKHYLAFLNPVKKIRSFIARRFALGKDPVEHIISFWQEKGPDFDYFAAAEDKHWMEVFWNSESIFYRLFSQLDLDSTLEIACGAGRHSFQVADKVRELFLLDSSEAALALAKERFKNYPNVHYIHRRGGTGIPRATIPAGSLSCVFSYDAMVHFEKETVFSYIREAYEVLRPGGLCLLHYSNYQANPGGIFSDNPGWRNYMNQDLFNVCVHEAGFTVVHTEVFDFSAPGSDAITLMRK